MNNLTKEEIDELLKGSEHECGFTSEDIVRMYDQDAKADAGKLRLTLVPTEISRAIARVRMYGTDKYHDPDNWKRVEPERYRDALLRHIMSYVDDPSSVDEESGLKHIWHAACNIAFLIQMEEHPDEFTV